MWTATVSRTSCRSSRAAFPTVPARPKRMRTPDWKVASTSVSLDWRQTSRGPRLRRRTCGVRPTSRYSNKKVEGSIRDEIDGLDNDYVLNASQSELEELDTEDISEERNEVTQSKVWGLPIRVVHWAIVVAFFLPFVMEDDALLMHEGFGYAAGALVIVRILYGIAGPEEAKLRHLMFAPTEALRYLLDLVRLRPKKYRLHTPAGGVMVIVLFLMVVATAGSGAGVAFGSGDVWEEAHEGLANLTVLLIMLHIAGTTATSLVQREVPFLPIIDGGRRPLRRRSGGISR